MRNDINKYEKDNRDLTEQFKSTEEQKQKDLNEKKKELEETKKRNVEIRKVVDKIIL